MAKHSETMKLLASKLGLSEEEKVLSKAAEFERRLQMKSTANSNMSDMGKVAICLDLAAAFFGVDFEVKTAIKYSGLKAAMYTNCRKVVENLLELNGDRLTTSMLCATLQCSGVLDLADNILEDYQRKAKLEVDLNLPQYVCMAVYQACRINKVKVSKSKIIDKSRLKPSQWSKLDAEWTKFVDEHISAPKRKKGRTAKNTVEDDQKEKVIIDCPSKQELPHEPQIEPYEDWKRRILEAAYEGLKALQVDVNNKPKCNQTQSPEKHKHIQSKQTHSPDKHKHIQSKQTCSPSKIKKQHLSPMKYSSKQINSPSKMNTKQIDVTNKQDLNKKINSLSKHKFNKEPLVVLQDAAIIYGFSPRRSPRKTPQKFEPYKSPTKTKGVRLLFPID